MNSCKRIGVCPHKNRMVQYRTVGAPTWLQLWCNGHFLQIAFISALSLHGLVIAAHPANYVVWQKSPMVQLRIETKPPSTSSISTLTAQCGLNEREQIAFVITNLSDKPLRGRIVLGVMTNENGEPFPLDHIEVRFASFVRVANPHIRQPKRFLGIFADPLPLANEANEFVIPPGQSQEVWLMFNTRGVTAGTYKGSLLIVPHYGALQRNLTVMLKVYPIKLPDYPPFHVFLWSEFIDRCGPRFSEGMLDEYLRDLREHWVDVVHVERFPYPIFDERGRLVQLMDDDAKQQFVAKLRKLKAHGFRMLHVALYFFWGGKRKTLGSKFAWMSPEWKRLATQWLTALIGLIKQAGFGYDQFAFLTYDEITTAKETDEFIKSAKFIKSVDPQARNLLTVCWSTPNSVIEKVAPYADILCVKLPPPRLLKHDFAKEAPCPPKRWEACRKAKQIWYYNTWCQKGWNPHSDLRAFVWLAWKYKLDGCCMWTYMSPGPGGDPWDDFDAKAKWIDEGMVYYDFARPPIPSRRWEAFREGVEDCMMLHMLEQAITKADPTQVASAKALLEEFKSETFYQGPEQLQQFRSKLLEELARLVAGQAVMRQAYQTLKPQMQSTDASATTTKQ